MRLSPYFALRSSPVYSTFIVGPVKVTLKGTGEDPGPLEMLQSVLYHCPHSEYDNILFLKWNHPREYPVSTSQ